MNALLLLSGGIDSTTTLAWLVERGKTVTALVFDYGQTLRKEIAVAYGNARRYDTKVTAIHFPMGWMPTRCSILCAHNTPLTVGRSRQQIAQQGTPSSYVPFRNGILLACAVAYGECLGIEDIYCGGNGLDSGNYWDDTRHFADAFTSAARIGTSPNYRPQIHYPMADKTKAEVVVWGLELGVEYANTWSCYQDRDSHCGVCDSCVQRRDALLSSGLDIEGHFRKRG